MGSTIVANLYLEFFAELTVKLVPIKQSLPLQIKHGTTTTRYLEVTTMIDITSKC